MTSEIDAEALRKEGATARAMGKSIFDNPYYRPAAMPVITGDSIELWSEKELAWRSGWEIEDAIRQQATP